MVEPLNGAPPLSPETRAELVTLFEWFGQQGDDTEAGSASVKIPRTVKNHFVRFRDLLRQKLGVRSLSMGRAMFLAAQLLKGQTPEEISHAVMRQETINALNATNRAIQELEYRRDLYVKRLSRVLPSGMYHAWLMQLSNSDASAYKLFTSKLREGYVHADFVVLESMLGPWQAQRLLTEDRVKSIRECYTKYTQYDDAVKRVLEERYRQDAGLLTSVAGMNTPPPGNGGSSYPTPPAEGT